VATFVLRILRIFSLASVTASFVPVTLICGSAMHETKHNSQPVDTVTQRIISTISILHQLLLRPNFLLRRWPYINHLLTYKT